jgi:intracellular septation protein
MAAGPESRLPYNVSVKFLLDFSPALLFFGAYLLADIYVATGVLIASLFGIVGVYWFWKRELHKAHLVTALVAALLGGLTIYIHDPTFIKVKPTVVYGIFALVLLGSQFIGDKPLLQRIPQRAIVMPDAVWRRVNLAWALFFVLCAVLNLYVAERFDEATWVKFKTFGFTALMFVFLLAHAPFLARYLPQE